MTKTKNITPQESQNIPLALIDTILIENDQFVQVHTLPSKRSVKQYFKDIKKPFRRKHISFRKKNKTL